MQVVPLFRSTSTHIDFRPLPYVMLGICWGWLRKSGFMSHGSIALPEVDTNRTRPNRFSTAHRF